MTFPAALITISLHLIMDIRNGFLNPLARLQHHRLIPYVKLFLLLLYLVLLVMRVPEIVFSGRFWAEEGVLYFQEAVSSTPLQFMTTTSMGYYSLWNKLACLAATIPPLEYAPIVTVMFSLIIQMIPAFLLLYSRISSLPGLIPRVVLLGLILVVQPNQEVWLTTINSQFHLCLITGIILISDAKTRFQHCFRLVLLFIAGTTGVLSCLFLPFFIVEAFVSGEKKKKHESMILGFACFVQLIAVALSPGRPHSFFWKHLPFALAIKQWVLPMFGPQAAATFSNTITKPGLYQNGWVALVMLLPYLIVLVYLIFFGRREITLLFIAMLLIVSFSFLYSMESQSAEMILIHMSPFGASRYYYAPNALLAIVFITSLKAAQDQKKHLRFNRKATQTLIIAVLALMGLTGARDFFCSKQKHAWFFSGPRWSHEAKQWRNGKSDTLRIWPRAWTMTLPRENAFPSDQRPVE